MNILISLLEVTGIALAIFTAFSLFAVVTGVPGIFLGSVFMGLVSIGPFLLARSLRKKIPLPPLQSKPPAIWPGTPWHCIAVFLTIISICFIDTPWLMPACVLAAAILYVTGRVLNLKLARETGAAFSYRDLTYPSISACVAILITIIVVPIIIQDQQEKRIQADAEAQVAPYGIPPECAQFVVILSRIYGLSIEGAAQITADALKSRPSDQQLEALQAVKDLVARAIDAQGGSPLDVMDEAKLDSALHKLRMKHIEQQRGTSSQSIHEVSAAVVADSNPPAPAANPSPEPYGTDSPSEEAKQKSDALFEKLLPEIQQFLRANPCGLLKSVSNPEPMDDAHGGTVFTQSVEGTNTGYWFTIKNDHLIRAHLSRYRTVDPADLEPDEPDLPADGKPTLNHFNNIFIGDTPSDVQEVMGTSGAIVAEETDMRKVEWTRGNAWMIVTYQRSDQEVMGKNGATFIQGKWKVTRKAQDGLQAYRPRKPAMPPPTPPRYPNIEERRTENRRARGY